MSHLISVKKTDDPYKTDRTTTKYFEKKYDYGSGNRFQTLNYRRMGIFCVDTQIDEIIIYQNHHV